MPAHNEHFPWLSYYGHYKFFESRMREHKKVDSFESIDNGLYHIYLTNGEKLKVFICECYAFGAAEYIESCDNHGALDAVIINSTWCQYSLELKYECMKQKVGIFNLADFMAALHRAEFWTYLNESEKKSLKYRG